MRIKSVAIHNFRSIKDARFDLSNYSVLVGANNSGKSNALTALRIFYEDGIKFGDSVDFPKFPTQDRESWIEIHYSLTESESLNLKDEYKNPERILRVRKYLLAEQRNRVKSSQSNIYAYEGNFLSKNLFYGARNISEAKLGSLIYIPEVITTDETLKLTGPSPLRNVLNFVMKKVVKTSESFESLAHIFDEFNSKFREEASKDGFSLNKLTSDINRELQQWGVEFNLSINPIRPEDIIKNLVSHHAVDKALDKQVDVKYLGQGLQRHLIYTLLRLSSEYAEVKTYERKEFAPALTVILFEEPEAFLHPGQQESLNASLKSLASEEAQQVIAATHSSIFVSKNIEDIPSLVKLNREEGVTRVFQVTEVKRKNIFADNNKLAQILQLRLEDSSLSEDTRNRIRDILGDADDFKRMEEEAIRYMLWLDSERCSSFFADTVLICEGASEKALIEYLIKNEWGELQQTRPCVLDALGKFNVHRYMNLFKELGIHHSVLADRDQDRTVHGIINEFIELQKNEYTRGVEFFENTIEDFLGVQPPPKNRRDKKPLNLMWHYSKGAIAVDKIESLRLKVGKLIFPQ